MTGGPGGTEQPLRGGPVRVLALRILRSRVARQVGALAGARGAAAAISFLWLALAARSLSLPEFADLALLLSLGAVTSVVADFGYALLLNEAVAAEPAKAWSTLTVVIRRRLALALVASMVMAGLYRLAAGDGRWVLAAVFAVSILATTWHTSCSAALRGAVSVVPEAANEVASRALVLLLGAGVLATGAGLLGVVAIYAVADVISAVGLTLVAWRRLPRNGSPDRPRFGLGRVVPLGLASVAAVVYYRIDIWLLAVMSTAGEVARYSISYRMLDVLILPAGAMAAVSIGSTARLDNRSAIRRTDRMVAVASICLLPAIAALALFPGSLLQLAFGSSYGPGGPVLRILALAIPPSVAVVLWAPLVALRGKGLLGVTVGSLAANLACNLALIPGLGAEGAALATVLGQTAFAIVLRLRLRAVGTDTAEPPASHPEGALHLTVGPG